MYPMQNIEWEILLKKYYALWVRSGMLMKARFLKGMVLGVWAELQIC